MTSTAVEAMLRSRRSFAVAAAGCGKTDLLARLVADQRSGRQLVLTHTHAGVAAIKAGKLHSTSAQFPKEIGRVAAEKVYDHLAGKGVEKDVKIKVELITKENADEFLKDK